MVVLEIDLDSRKSTLPLRHQRHVEVPLKEVNAQNVLREFDSYIGSMQNSPACFSKLDRRMPKPEISQAHAET